MAELETTVLVSEIEAIERAARRALDAYRDAIARAEAAEATLERVREYLVAIQNSPGLGDTGNHGRWIREALAALAPVTEEGDRGM